MFKKTYFAAWKTDDNSGHATVTCGRFENPEDILFALIKKVASELQMTEDDNVVVTQFNRVD